MSRFDSIGTISKKFDDMKLPDVSSDDPNVFTVQEYAEHVGRLYSAAFRRLKELEKQGRVRRVFIIENGHPGWQIIEVKVARKKN